MYFDYSLLTSSTRTIRIYWLFTFSSWISVKHVVIYTSMKRYWIFYAIEMKYDVPLQVGNEFHCSSPPPSLIVYYWDSRSIQKKIKPIKLSGNSFILSIYLFFKKRQEIFRRGFIWGRYFWNYISSHLLFGYSYKYYCILLMSTKNGRLREKDKGIWFARKLDDEAKDHRYESSPSPWLASSTHTGRLSQKVFCRCAMTDLK